MDGSLLVIAWPGIPPIGLDVALLDRVEATDSELVLAIGELEVAMNIADGPDAARELDDSAHVGAMSLPIGELEAMAERGETLTLPHGGYLPAAMTLLVVAAERRPGGRQDPVRLEERVARYERRIRSG